MSINDRDIVADLHEALRTQIGEDRFEVWIQSQVTFQYSEPTLRITVRDSFSMDQIKRRFGGVIAEQVNQICRSNTSIEWSASDIVSSFKDADGGNHRKDQLSNDRLNSSEEDVNGSHSTTLRLLATEERRVDDGADRQPSKSARTTRPKLSLSQSTVDSNRSQFPVSGNGTGHRTTNGRRERGEFSQFVVGEENRLAYSAATHACQQLGEVSPLYFHGPNGSGKSHLLQSIYSDVVRRKRHRSLLITSEQFTTGFLDALHGRGLPNFRRKYRSLDLLLIDDVQFFIGKRATLVELLYTIDSLVQDGRQIVLSADRPPHELSGVGNEIIARLTAGLTCAIDYPQGSERVELVREIAKRRRVELNPATIELLARELYGDARQIRGAINRLTLLQDALGEELTVDRARRELSDLFQSQLRPLAINDIERVVCDVFGVDGPSLRSDRKSKHISQPRMLAMWLARKHTKAAYSEIGEYFGGRSHSTVISAANKVQKWVGGNADIQVACGESSVVDTIRRIETTLRAV